MECILDVRCRCTVAIAHGLLYYFCVVLYMIIIFAVDLIVIMVIDVSLHLIPFALRCCALLLRNLLVIFTILANLPSQSVYTQHMNIYLNFFSTCSLFFFFSSLPPSLFLLLLLLLSSVPFTFSQLSSFCSSHQYFLIFLR